MNSPYSKLPANVRILLENVESQHYKGTLAALWLLVDGLREQGVNLIKMADSEETMLALRQDDLGWTASEALAAAVGGDEAFTLLFKDRVSGLIEKLWVIIDYHPWEIVTDGSETCERIGRLATEIMAELEPEPTPKQIANIQGDGATDFGRQAEKERRLGIPTGKGPAAFISAAEDSAAVLTDFVGTVQVLLHNVEFTAHQVPNVPSLHGEIVDAVRLRATDAIIEYGVGEGAFDEDFDDDDDDVDLGKDVHITWKINNK